MKAIFPKIFLSISIFFTIVFLLLFFTDYEIDNFIVAESFYVVVSVLLILTFFLSRQLSINPFWKSFFDSFIVATCTMSLLMSLFAAFDHPQFPDLCENLSPDDQKSFVVRDMIPAASWVDVAIRYKNFPLINRVLMTGLLEGEHGKFCITKWVDNDTLLIPNPDKPTHGKEFVLYKIGLIQIYWQGIKHFSIVYGIMMLYWEVIKQYRKIRPWLSSTVSNWLQKY